jgi:hypothetical protein
MHFSHDRLVELCFNSPSLVPAVADLSNFRSSVQCDTRSLFDCHLLDVRNVGPVFRRRNRSFPSQTVSAIVAYPLDSLRRKLR